MSSESNYITHPNVKTALTQGGGARLFDPDRNRTRFVNETGAFIWKRLDGRHGAQDIAEEFRACYEAPGLQEVREDVRAFLQDAVRDGYAVSGRDAPLRTPDAFPEIEDAPGLLDVSLTGTCNLRCEYCFYENEMNRLEDLATPDWLCFFDELGRLPVQSLCLSGGEIFVRPDLWELVDGLIANRMRYSILTNGTLITEKTLEAFEQAGRRRRLDSIQVSIDGSCAEIHEKSRGTGSFARAARGLRLLKEAGFPVTCRVTVNRYNVGDLENTARLLLDEIGLGSFTTNDAVPLGGGGCRKDSVGLTTGQRLEAMKTLGALAKRYNGRITATAGPLAELRFFNEMKQARETGEPLPRARGGFLTGCGCVFSKLAVLHDGTLVPCNMLPGLGMGNIREDSVRDIWKTHPTLQALRERRKIPMREVPGCTDCDWAELCTGGCPAVPLASTGRLDRANRMDCFRSFLEEAGHVPAG